jgi:hypothetical protein
MYGLNDFMLYDGGKKEVNENIKGTSNADNRNYKDRNNSVVSVKREKSI